MTSNCLQIQWSRALVLSATLTLAACSSSSTTNDGAQGGGGGTTPVSSGGSTAIMDAAVATHGDAAAGADGSTTTTGGSTVSSGGVTSSGGSTAGVDAPVTSPGDSAAGADGSTAKADGVTSSDGATRSDGNTVGMDAAVPSPGDSAAGSDGKGGSGGTGGAVDAGPTGTGGRVDSGGPGGAGATSDASSTAGTGGIVDARGIGDVGGASADAGTTLNSTGNLIVNGDAEEGVGSSDGSPVPVPGWTVTGEATAVQYGVVTSGGAYPAATDPGPVNRGLNFFSGGQNDTTSTLAQTISLASYATGIDAGAVTFALQGYLGGFSTQDDNAVLSVSFKNASGTELAAATIGPVTEPDRSGLTGLLLRSTTGSVPVGSRSVVVTVTMTRLQGTYNDGYADNLSLVLTGI